MVNFTEQSIPYTRIIEHKHFEFNNQLHTIITKEYPKNGIIIKTLIIPLIQTKMKHSYLVIKTCVIYKKMLYLEVV